MITDSDPLRELLFYQDLVFSFTLHGSSFPSLLLSSLELSDTNVYEPQVRARVGTASHFYGSGARVAAFISHNVLIEWF